MIVTLSWPNKLLWPNGPRGNHYAVSAAKKRAKHDASWATIAARSQQGVPDLGEGEIPITIRAYAKPKGPLPDKDNIVASLKVQLDSIAAEIGVNDRRFSAPVVTFCEPRVGRIEVVINRPAVPHLSPRESADDTNEAGRNAAETAPGPDQKREVTR